MQSKVNKRKRKDEKIVPHQKSKKPRNEVSETQAKNKANLSGDPNLFINRLNSRDPSSALQDLAKVENPTELVNEFFNSGGQVSTILNTLEPDDDKIKAVDAVTVFAACQSIFICVAKSQDPKLSFGGRGFSFCLELCRTLLDSYNKDIMQMLLPQSQALKVKTTLKLLTSMVTLGPATAKMVVLKLDWDSTAWKSLPDRVFHKDQTDVRTCYIHFLLSFLMEPTQFILKEYFERKTRLATIFPGLVQDRAELVLLVIDTLRTKVIETATVTKTYKMKLFGSYSLKNLLELCKWKGPKTENADLEDREEEREEIRTAILDLLRILLTNTKLGVVFQDNDYACEKSSNNLVSEFLQDLQKPWESPHLARLTADVLAASPGEIPAYLDKHYRDGALQPRDSDVWNKLVDMYYVTFKQLDVKKVVSNYNRRYLKVGLHILKNIMFPSQLVDCLVSKGVNNEKCTVSAKCLEILEILLQNTEQFVKESCSTQLEDEYKSLCQQKLPKFDILLKIWNKEISSKNTIFLNSILSVIGLRVRVFNDEVGTDIINMLKDLDGLNLTQTEESPARDPRIHVLSIIANILDTTDQSLSFLVSFISADTFNILLNCLTSSVAAEAGSARSVLTRICYNTRIARSDRMDFDLLLQLGSSNKDLLPETANILWRTLSNVQALEQEVLGYENNNLTSSQVDDILNALIQDDCVPQLAVERKSVGSLSPLVISFLDSEHSEDMQGVVANILECLMVAGDDKSELFDVVSERGDNLSKSDTKELENVKNGKSVDKSVAWLTKEAAMTSTILAKVYASKLAALNETAELLQLLESLEDDDKKSVTEHLFRRSMYCKFDLFSKKSKDVVLVLLPFVDKFDVVCEDFKKNLLATVMAAVVSDKVKKVESTRVQKVFEHLDFGKEDLTDILEKISEQGVNKFIDDESKLNQRGLVLAGVLANIFCHHQNKFEGLQQVFVKLSSHIEFLLEKETGSSLATALLKVVRIHPQICDSLSVNVLYVLTSNISSAEHRDIIVLLAKNSTKMCESLLEWLSKTKSDVSSDLHILSLANAMLGEGLRTEITENKKVIKSLIKKAVSLVTSKISDLTDDSQVGQVVVAVDTIKSLSSSVRSSKLVTFVQQLFTESKDSIRNILNGESSEFLRKKITIEFAYNVLKIVEEVENNAKKSFLNLVLVPIIEMLPGAASQQLGQDKPSLVTLCQVGQATAASQSHSAVQTHLKKNKEAWSSLIKCILRHGLKDDEFGVPGLELLTTLCRLRYGASRKDEDSCEDDEDGSEMNLVVDMVISHSAYLNILLGPPTNLKEKVINLLTELSPASCRQDQVDLLLAGYTARLHPADTAILRLLCVMEKNGVNVNNKKPLLFGPQAVSQYTGGQSGSSGLNKFSECLAQIKPDIVLKTATNFPLSLPLDPTADSSADIPESCHSLYDPRFILPYVSSLTSEDVYIDRHMKIVESNVVSLALVALSSEDQEMRSAGYHVLHRFHVKMNESKLLTEKQIWVHLVDLVKNGLARASDSKVCFRLPNITTLFLARSFAIIQNPTYHLYPKLSAFLLAKPFLELFHVPDFVRLFHSSEVNPRQQQTWVLSVVKEGLRGGLDHKILIQDHVYRIILSNMTSSLADSRILLLGLEVVEAASKLETAALDLLGQLGILQWCNLAVANVTEEKELEVVTNIYNNLKQVLAPSTQQSGEESEATLKFKVTMNRILTCNINILMDRAVKVSRSSVHLVERIKQLC